MAQSRQIASSHVSQKYFRTWEANQIQDRCQIPCTGASIARGGTPCMKGPGGRYYLIWPKRVSATEQGMVFKVLSLTQGYIISLFSILNSMFFKLVPRVFPLEIERGALSTRLRSLSNDDGDVNENGKKTIGFRIGKTTALHVHQAFFCTFLCSHCATTTWKCQISRFMEYVKTRQRLSFPFPELRYSLSEFNSRENCQHLIN